jgi:hypothetical protein
MPIFFQQPRKPYPRQSHLSKVKTKFALKQSTPLTIRQFLSITQASKKANIQFIQEAASAGIALLRFAEKFEATPDDMKPYKFTEILECAEYFAGGEKEVIDIHKSFCKDIRSFLTEYHPYFETLLDENAQRDKALSKVLTSDFVLDVLSNVAEKFNKPAENAVLKTMQIRKWQLRQYLAEHDYNINETKNFLLGIARDELNLPEGTKVKKLNSAHVKQIDQSISEEDRDDCPPISNVWDDIKRRLGR